MSLRHLFSKPKVERARGYGEPGLAAPSVASLKNPSAGKMEVGSMGQNDGASIRAPSIWSFRGNRNHNSNTRVLPPEFKAPPRERKLPPLDPPPLFQAFPQAIKDGILEVSALSMEASSKSKNKKGTNSRLQSVSEGTSGEGEDATTLETGESEAPGGSRVNQASAGLLSKKMFVLLTSGYLLQYNNIGPSDRLPEKILSLGRDSAAFACDHIAGRHFVLQVSEAVDQQGETIPHSNSLLSKIGIRSTTARRMTSSFVLVMQDAKEMEGWMTAIRRKIELEGGRKFGSNSPTDGDGNPMHELKKTPSHRYLVKRDPSRVSNVSSPASTPAQEIPAFTLPIPQQNGRTPTSSRPQSAVSEAATIDGIEAEASRLVDENVISLSTTARSPSDTPSFPTVPDGQESRHTRAAKLRINTNVTRRPSDTSAPASASGIASPSSITRSIVDSPISEAMSNNADGSPSDYIQTAQTAVPILSRRLNSSSGNLAAASSNSVILIESPVIERKPYPKLGTEVSSSHRLSSAKSEPNLQRSMGFNAIGKRDSKMPTPLTLVTEAERPESIVGDLPPSSKWSSPKSGGRRFSGLTVCSSTAPSAQPLAMSCRSSAVAPVGILKQPSTPISNNVHDGPRPIAPPNVRRLSSFSIPLKVNPSTAWNQHAPSLNNRRASKMSDPDPASETPQVHTLTAKVDTPAGVKRFSLSPTPTASPLSDRFPTIPSRASPTPLPFFPNSTQPTPSSTPTSQSGFHKTPSSPPTPPKNTSPTTSQTQSQSQSRNASLRRPVSLHVRADHAPFLSNSRSSSNLQSSSQSALPRRPSLPGSQPPIRGLRPSRSASNMPLLAVSSSSPSITASPPEAFRGLVFNTPPQTLTEGEEVHSVSPSEVPSSQSPALRQQVPPVRPARVSSRSGNVRTSSHRGRTLRTRTSLPDIDGQSMFALGPPAPPPSAPLPAPPSHAAMAGTASRTMVNYSSHVGRHHGVEVAHSVGPTTSPPSTGLGIQVG